ncbi:MAG: DUF433 domain-containing protein [Burkholderiales bacterium]|nr:DUF433 domain-containing protein [Anaerolineae bacterium]
MSEQMLSERIVVSREVVHGKPRIVGTRVMVVQVLDLLAAGKSIAEIISDDYFPVLNEADVRACIAYASQIIRDDRVVPTV